MKKSAIILMRPTFSVLLLLWAGLGIHLEAIGPAKDLIYTAIEDYHSLDTLPPMWEARDEYDLDQNPFDLNDPAIVKEEVEFDTENNNYILSKKIGEEFYTAPSHMSFQEYLDYKQKMADKEFMQKMNGLNSDGGFLDFAAGKADGINPVDNLNIQEDLVGGMFGGAQISIKPQGYVDFTFGGRGNFYDNPANPPEFNRQGFLPYFQPNINLRVEGGIGDKFNLGWDYNTQSTFDFDNRIKLAYDSEEWSEDEIVKKIEAGDVSLPLNSQLINGSQRLFGVKTELQFGKLTLTGLISQQKSQKKEIVIENGGRIREFFKYINEYDENRHFFLTHYNRETYERSLANLPQINTLFKIRKIELWTTNKNQQETDVLSEIIAVTDLGEPERISMSDRQYFPTTPRHPDIYDGKPLPGFELASQIGANDLFSTLRNDPAMRSTGTAKTRLENFYNMVNGQDFERLRARKLQRDRDYFVHEDLGFVSLNRQVETDEVLGVALEYEFNGKVYQIGEFNDDADSVLIVKLLKSQTNDVSNVSWDLMMKNIYSVGAYQVDREDFQLDIFYDDPGKGEKRFLPAPELDGRPLLQIFNLDNLNPVGDPQPDGRFDFVPDLTILPRTGKIIFPVLEPFGSSLRNYLASQGVPEEEDIYSFPELYSNTIINTLQSPETNRFVIRGKYKSDVTADISLGAFNIPRGSVVVTAGGRRLQEGLDYEIDYNIGRIKILNESYLASGPVKISFEDNGALGFQVKTMMGLRADYRVNKHINVGGTFMHLYERPFTPKVNIGDDPINNRVYGLDFSYEKSAPWLTRLVDKIPGIDTKEESKIKFYAETAFLKPGHARAIRQGDEEDGTVYLDDFEGSSNGVPVESFHGNWTLASIPSASRFDNVEFLPEHQLNNDLNINVNRALMSWYRILDTEVGDNINNSHYSRVIQAGEIFPQRQLNIQQSITRFLTFDVSYFPNERGPYNFDRPGGTAYSAGINADGELLDPRKRWAGIMTNNTTPDFERANYETLEFWVMSPYLEDPQSDNTGYLVFNLGNISEDVLKDSEKFAEHALPTDPNNRGLNVDTTNLSIVSTIDPAINAFENDQESRNLQDVGYDGMDNDQERLIYQDYINEVLPSLNPGAANALREDPSNDDFVSIGDDRNGNGVINRYKRFSMPQGDSQINTGQFGNVNQFKNFPDQEDLDQDGSLDEIERYFEYRIPIEPDGNGGIMLNDYIISSRTVSNTTVNGVPAQWFRVKIPLADTSASSKVGNIADFRNMQFLRMYMHGFENQITFRFAEMEYGRNLWRRYLGNLKQGVVFPTPGDETEFNISAINVEENSDETPFGYDIPIGIIREQIQSFNQNLQQNEQSLNLDICNLKQADARGIIKELFLDLRRYKTLRMFSHLENSDFSIDPNDGDLSLFIRLGSDYQNNYYEYEIPLTYSRDNSLPRGSRAYKEELWRIENELELKLQDLIGLKRERNRNTTRIDSLYAQPDPLDPSRTLKIKGNPNMGYVKGIMIGVRNNSDRDQCFELWVNELRVTGLDERGGMAALAQVEAQLADFGNLSLAGHYSTIGYGDIDQKVGDRSLEDVRQLDASINLELGKFFKEESGIKIPFYAQYNEVKSTPEFDPYDLDIKLQDKLADAEDAEERKIIEDQAIEKTTIKGYNFTNVRKERTNGKTPMPWDVENLTASYAYNEIDRTTPIIELDNEKNYTGSLGYDYSMRPLYIYPFKKLIKKGKYLKIIKDINLNPIPNVYSFNTVVDRKISEARYRFAEPAFSTWYTKRFTWDRNYGLNWDITQSLKFKYNSTAMAVIDEPPGKIDTDEKRDSIRTNIRDLGRLKNYNHNISLNYTLPINKIPILDWVKAKAQYGADYNWSVAALNMDSLGNIISNSQRIQLGGDLNFQRLYSKSKYLAKIDRGNRSRSRRTPSVSNNKEVTTKIKKGSSAKGNDVATWEKILIRPLMTLRQGRLNYVETKGTTIPGFTPRAKLLGQNDNWSAPGWKFVAGIQPDLATYLPETAENGWITQSLFLNSNVLQDETQQYDASLKLEPFNNFVVDLTATKQSAENHTEKFKIFEPGGTYERRVPYDMGSYTISFFSLNTFLNGDIDGLFNTFEQYRIDISQRIGTPGTIHPEDPRYTEGYGPLHQDVLIPAFIAAYTDQSPNSVELDLFKLRPKVNWDLSYKGLSKIPFFSERVKQFSLDHGYRSTLQVNQYNTESNYDPSNTVKLNEQTNNYYSRFEVPNVIINEELSPLIGVNTTLFNDMNFGFDYSKARSLNLNFVTDNKHIIESNSTTVTFSFGYLMKEVNIGFLTGKNKKKKKKKKSPAAKQDLLRLDELRDTELQELFDFSVEDEKTGDLQMNLDFSIRDEITKNHLIDKETDQVTRGAQTISLSPSVDYSLNKKVNFRVFFDYTSTNPYTTQQFRRVNYAGGVTVRLSLE